MKLFMHIAESVCMQVHPPAWFFLGGGGLFSVCLYLKIGWINLILRHNELIQPKLV
jgi:hypothetical protein